VDDRGGTCLETQRIAQAVARRKDRLILSGRNDLRARNDDAQGAEDLLGLVLEEVALLPERGLDYFVG
jgi:hypothetical protein